MIAFWSSFDGSRFASERPQIDSLGRTDFQQIGKRLRALARPAGIGAEAFVTGYHQIEHTFEAEVPDGLLALRRGPLHEAADEVEGDDAHPKGLVRHVRAFYLEALHAEGGFEVAQFQFDVPAPGVEVRQFDAAVLFRIGQGGDDDELALLSGPVLVAEFDEAQFEGGGLGVPLFVYQVAAARLLGAVLGDESFIGGKPFAFPPV